MLVPENIFEIAPSIKNINDYNGLGAQFKSFKDKNQFSVSVTFEISNEAYYNDELLIINDKSVDLNNMGNMLLNNYGFDGKLKDLVVLDDIKTSISKSTLDNAESNIKNKLNEIKNGIHDPSTLPTCPPPTTEEASSTTAANTTKINIKNKDNTIIQTVTMDLADNSKTCTTSDGIVENLKATFLNALPNIDPGNNIAPSTVSPICQLPDNSELKTKVQLEVQKLNLGQSTLQNYNKNLLDDGLSKAVSKQLKLIETTTGKSLSDRSPENINNLVKDTLKNSLPAYGIPILQINLDLNIIIQVENGKLSVLNFDKYISGQSVLDKTYVGPSKDSNLKNSLPDIAKKKLEIDYGPNTDAKVIPDVIYTLVYTRKFNYHSLELKRFYGTEVYKDEEVSSIGTGLYYLGMDKSGLKQFCGKFYDVHLQKDPIDINKITFGENYLPTIYGALAYYNFFNKSKEETKVVHNRVYPYKSLGKPLAIQGKNWYYEPRKSGNYTFPNHAIIDDMFCKNKFTNTSFGISLFFKRNSFMHMEYNNPDYSITRQVIVSDVINNNFVYYDERNMFLVINFHGFVSKIFVNFVPGMWYQLTLRYDFEKQKFITRINYKNLRDTARYDFLKVSTTRTIKGEMDLDKDIGKAATKNFQLNSLYAEYSFSNRWYLNPFDTLCGPIVLYDSYLEDLIIDGLFESFYPVLNYYKDVGGIYDEKGILNEY